MSQIIILTELYHEINQVNDGELLSIYDPTTIIFEINNELFSSQGMLSLRIFLYMLCKARPINVLEL
jgi:hypothetical protein